MVVHQVWLGIPRISAMAGRRKSLSHRRISRDISSDHDSLGLSSRLKNPEEDLVASRTFSRPFPFWGGGDEYLILNTVAVRPGPALPPDPLAKSRRRRPLPTKICNRSRCRRHRIAHGCSRYTVDGRSIVLCARTMLTFIYIMKKLGL